MPGFGLNEISPSHTNCSWWSKALRKSRAPCRADFSECWALRTFLAASLMLCFCNKAAVRFAQAVCARFLPMADATAALPLARNSGKTSW